MDSRFSILCQVWIKDNLPCNIPLTTLPRGCPPFLEIPELPLDARKCWATSGLTRGAGVQPWGPCSLPSIFKRTPLEGFEVAAVMQDGPREVFSPLPPCPELCVRAPATLLLSPFFQSHISLWVLCALCSWNRIWTRYSSIWRKWDSLTSLASAKQQERGNASCATILRKLPVREPSLPSACCPESLAPLGFTGTYEPCRSSWPSPFILGCSNAQGGAGSPLPRAEKGVSPKWDWEKGKRWRGRET